MEIPAELMMPVADQEVFRLLEAGRALVVNAAEEQRALLEEIKAG
jgi:hypothetical protein